VDRKTGEGGVSPPIPWWTLPGCSWTSIGHDRAAADQVSATLAATLLAPPVPGSQYNLPPGRACRDAAVILLGWLAGPPGGGSSLTDGYFRRVALWVAVTTLPAGGAQEAVRLARALYDLWGTPGLVAARGRARA
jgi:hypothetical protein